MSEKKMFTAEEVARMILEKAHNTLKKHEEMLQKSKNTAHEIDAGEEPKNDEAECPESLKGEGSSEASGNEPKKIKAPAEDSEDPSMEDEPLSDSDSEEDESEEDEEEDEYEFRKSESGMHTVQYKMIKSEFVERRKENKGFPSRSSKAPEKHWRKDTDDQYKKYMSQETEDRAESGEDRRSSKGSFDDRANRKTNRNNRRYDDPGQEQKRTGKMDGQVSKKEKPLKKLMSATSTMPGSVASTGGPSIGSQIGFPGIKKEENQPPKENPQYHIRATQEGKTPKKEWTSATRKEIDYSRSGMKGAKPSSPEDQKRFEAEAKERAKKFKEQPKK